jgi:hypothetical protein
MKSMVVHLGSRTVANEPDVLTGTAAILSLSWVAKGLSAGEWFVKGEREKSRGKNLKIKVGECSRQHTD